MNNIKIKFNKILSFLLALLIIISVLNTDLFEYNSKADESHRIIWSEHLSDGYTYRLWDCENYQNIGQRNVYILGINDIVKYLGVERICNKDLMQMFYNQDVNNSMQSIWLRTAGTGHSESCFCVSQYNVITHTLFDMRHELRPAFKIDLKAPGVYSGTMPKKGDLIYLKSMNSFDRKYRVLNIKSGEAELLDMNSYGFYSFYELPGGRAVKESDWKRFSLNVSTQNGNTTKEFLQYEDSWLDNLTNVTYFNALKKEFRDAIIPQNIDQDIYEFMNEDHPRFVGETPQFDNDDINTGDEKYIDFSSEKNFNIGFDTKSWDGIIEYSTDMLTWNEYNSTDTNIQSIKSGKFYHVYFRGKNSYLSNSDIKSNCTNFKIDGEQVYCDGNIMNLIDYDDPPTTIDVPNCFAHLFDNCTSLVTPPTLSAITLADSCYRSMFENCTSLYKTPYFPSSILTNNCFNSMFKGCSSLIKIYPLNYTYLANSCYKSMFEDCTSLETAINLPAFNLADSCYYKMFSGCTKLRTTPVFNANTIGTSSCEYMFKNCESIKKMPELKATVLSSRSYYGMFSGCVNLINIQNLNLTKTDDMSCANMFENCTSLKIYEEGTGNYKTPWKVPSQDNVSSSHFENMFLGTGGAFTGTPQIGVTYYQYSDIITIHFCTPQGDGDMEDFVYRPYVDSNSKLPKANYISRGYEVTGWGLVRDARTAVYPNECDVNTMGLKPGSELKLYAVWYYGTYYIKYDANGGTGTMEMSAAYCHRDVNLRENQFTKEGYIFDGWALSPDATSGHYSFDDSLSIDNGAIVTLYAVWIKPWYSISFLQNGGSGYMPMVYADLGEPFKLPPNKFTKDGYRFLGWSKTRNSTTIDFEDEAYVLNLTDECEKQTYLYAVWELIPNNENDTPLTANYTVEHYFQNLKSDLSTIIGDDINTTNFTLKQKDTLSGNIGELSNARSIDSDGFEFKPFIQKSINQDGSTVIKIYYVRKKYDIVFRMGENGAWNNNEYTKQLYYGTKISKSLPSDYSLAKRGYKFSKWIVDGDESINFDDLLISNNHVIVATFIPKQFLINDESLNINISNLKNGGIGNLLPYTTTIEYSSDDTKTEKSNYKVVSSNPTSVSAVNNSGTITVKGLKYGKSKISIYRDSIDEENLLGTCNVNVYFYDTTYKEDSASHKSIYWAAEKGITVGYNNGEYFGPNRNTSRVEFAIFLWRHAGQPEVGGNMDFVDCTGYAPTTAKYKAIKWAYYAGIVKGSIINGKPYYKPDDNVSRLSVAIMIYRYGLYINKTAGFNKLNMEISPNAKQFADMTKYKTSSDSYKSVLWMAEQEISKGYLFNDKTIYKPNDNCIRVSLLILLYRTNEKLVID